MKIALLIILVLLFGFLAYEAYATEVITAEQQRDYQRARANLLQAQQQAATAQKVFEDVITSLQSICGSRGLIADAKGDPVCGDKPQGTEKR